MKNFHVITRYKLNMETLVNLATPPKEIFRLKIVIKSISDTLKQKDCSFQ